MGFFSWKTADTKKPINNVHGRKPHTRIVYLLQPDKQPPIQETAYDGYGMFGGIDAYAWLARMNLNIDGSDDDIRGDGISLQYSGKPIEYPLKFSFNKDAKYEDLPASEDDPNQGFFY